MQHYDPEQALATVRREFGEHGGVAPSISRSSTFTVMQPGTMPEIFHGLKGPESGGCFLYSRHFNPTNSVLGRYLAAMEFTESAVTTASGMSAISSTLLQLCKAGDHIVASNTVYGGTHALLQEVFPQMGIEVSLVLPSDTEAFRQAIRPNTKAFYTETVANPTLKIADIPALSQIAKANKISLVVDNTFTPMVISPAKLGADIVVYSLTKFINGASDIIGGAICASKDFINKLMDLHTGRVMLLGPTMDPRVAFDLIQRLPHLAIRMREHGRRALAFSETLWEMGIPVNYTGLPTFPQKSLADQLFNEGYGYGGMMTIDCGTKEKADTLSEILQNEEKFGLLAVSLGYFDTLISCSGSTTSSEIAEAEQREMGLSPGLLRIAVGYTGNLQERLNQLKKAVKKIF
jgi:methionine-gamma-lyase